MKVISEKIRFKGKLVVEEGKLSHMGQTFKRERLKRENASAVLLINNVSNKIILTRQFRYAIKDNVHKEILEIAAGKIDKGETPEEAAIREVKEETGHRVKKKNLKLLATCFSSPGYSSEKFFIYMASVTNSDRMKENHGLHQEGEFITTVEMDLKEFHSLIIKGKIEDAKTCIAGLQMFAGEKILRLRKTTKTAK